MPNKIIFSVPSQELSVHRLTSVLRILEMLVAFRGITPGGELSSTWSRLYAEYMRVQLREIESVRPRSYFSFFLFGGIAYFPSLYLGREEVVSSEAFEAWISAEFVGMDLLPIEDIKPGSYEFVLQAVNLVSVFGLQDFSLIKDLVQWVCTTLGQLIAGSKNSDGVANSGGVSMRLTPALVRELKHFDEVDLKEEVTSEGVTLKITLKKR